MPSVPDPSDLAIQFLVWLGLPAILVALIQSALALIGWASFGRRTLTVARATRANAAALVANAGRTSLGCVIKTAAAGGLFTALAYAGAQVVDFVFVREYGGAPPTIETISDVEFLTEQVFSYAAWSPLSRAAFLGAAGYVVIVNVAHLVGAPSLAWIARGPWFPILVVCGLAGIAGAAVGVIVLLNAAIGYIQVQFGNGANDYTLGSVSLYAGFALVGLGMPWLATQFEDASKNLWITVLRNR